MSARRRDRRPPRPVTFAEIALAVVGAAVVVLALTALAVALMPVSPRARAGIAILGIAGTLAIMSVVSNKMSDRAVRAEFGPADHPSEDPGAVDPGETSAPGETTDGDDDPRPRQRN